MARFRKIPVEIDAVQLTWTNWGAVCNLAEESNVKIEGTYLMPDGTEAAGVTNDIGCYIETLEGRMLARQGDWIIRGVNGELYPCKDDIFRKTYEKVDLRG